MFLLHLRIAKHTGKALTSWTADLVIGCVKTFAKAKRQGFCQL
jgi:hypothetical protein